MYGFLITLIKLIVCVCLYTILFYDCLRNLVIRALRPNDVWKNHTTHKEFLALQSISELYYIIIIIVTVRFSRINIIVNLKVKWHFSLFVNGHTNVCATH
jgi:hypothetical protein